MELTTASKFVADSTAASCNTKELADKHCLSVFRVGVFAVSVNGGGIVLPQAADFYIASVSRCQRWESKMASRVDCRGQCIESYRGTLRVAHSLQGKTFCRYGHNTA